MAERLTIGLVSTGDVLDNHDAQRLGLTNVFLQDDDEIMKAYRVQGTPSAVMVSPDGRIASTAAAGATAIEPLIRVTLRRHTNATSVDTVAADCRPNTAPRGLAWTSRPSRRESALWNSSQCVSATDPC